MIPQSKIRVLLSEVGEIAVNHYIQQDLVWSNVEEEIGGKAQKWAPEHTAGVQLKTQWLEKKIKPGLTFITDPCEFKHYVEFLHKISLNPDNIPKSRSSYFPLFTDEHAVAQRS